MDARRLGAILIVVGLVTTAVGVLGVLSTAPKTSQSSTPTAFTAASPTATASPTPEATPQATATASPTADPETLARAFFAELVAAIRVGTRADMLPRLHPAVIDRYGEEACRENLSTGTADPTYDIVVRSVEDPGPWDYAADGLTTTIPGTWTVQADVTSEGTTEASELHVTPIDGQLRWFTDCGDPLAS